MQIFTSQKTQQVLEDKQRKNFSDVARSNPTTLPNSSEAAVVFPPFDVLLAWLSYTYQQTGEWPKPTEDFGLVDKKLELELNPSLKPHPMKFSQDEAVPTGNFKKLRLIAKNEPTLETHHAAAYSEFISTNFDYVNSPYFLEAVYLIDKFATYPISDELRFGCEQVLSLILAWCHFPLFKGTGGRQGEWMVLATVHCSRELKMRVSSFRECITALEKAGLVAIGQAGTEFLDSHSFHQLRHDCSKVEYLYGKEAACFWSSRSIQSKTLVYRLNKELIANTSLPEFEPFKAVHCPSNESNYTEERLDYNWKGMGNSISSNSVTGKDLSRIDNTRDSQEVLKSPDSGSFPGIPCHELINHDDVDAPISVIAEEVEAENAHIQPLFDNLNQLSSINNSEDPNSRPNLTLEQTLVQRLTSEQLAKFEFLNTQASFNGYSRNDGRTTLDTQEALKFALKADLSFATLHNYYKQVNERWIKGRCRKNPIGLLHWAITNNADLSDLDDKATLTTSQASTNSCPASDNGGIRPANSGDKFDSYKGIGTREKRQNQRASWKTRRNFRNPQAFSTDSAFESEMETDLQSDNDARSSAMAKPGLNNEALIHSGPDLNDPAGFWKEVIETDLAGRFRLNKGEIALLAGSKLEVTDDLEEGAKQIKVLLRSVIEETQLGLATRSTIQLAFRQRLGPGFRLVFAS